MKQLKDLPKDWKGILFESGQNSLTKTETLRRLGVTIRVHQRFMRDYEEYREAFEKREIDSFANFIERGRQKIWEKDKDFDRDLYKFFAAIQFGLFPNKVEGSKKQDSNPESKIEKGVIQEKYKIRRVS